MSFDEWYREYWLSKSTRSLFTATQVAEDHHRAMIAWTAAKDFNPVNLQDLEYICEVAMQHLGGTEEGWRGRAHYYRDKLRELFGEMPG